MQRYKAIIVSDVHLGTDNSKAAEFLEFLNTHHTDILIINGDFVDGWALSRGVRWRGKHTKVISKVLDISRKIPVVWIRGNHDEFLHDLKKVYNFYDNVIELEYKLFKEKVIKQFATREGVSATIKDNNIQFGNLIFTILIYQQ